MKKNEINLLLFLVILFSFCIIITIPASGLIGFDYRYGDYICRDYGENVSIVFIENSAGESVAIPEKINGKAVTEVSIDSYENRENTSITFLSLPDTVHTVRVSLKNLEQVHLRGDFSIYRDRFEIRGEKVTSITVDSNNSKLISFDGVLFSKDLRILYQYPKGKTDKHFYVPQGVEAIWAFNNNYIESIYFPETTTSVPWTFMLNCPNINKIYVDNLDSWFKISACYFFDSPWQPYDLYIENQILKELVIPDGMTKLLGYTFYNCRSIESIIVPESLKSVGRYTFAGTAWMKNQTGDIIYLDNIAISNNSTSSIISIREGTKYIADYAFSNYMNNIEAVVLPNSLKEIGEEAFIGAEKLKEIFIPESVEYIGAHAIGYYSYHYTQTDSIYKKYDNGLVIKGIKGSVAETYAKENDITFIAIDETNPEEPTKPSTPTEDCSCNCHKSGIVSVIWKILRFFYKILRINSICTCGIAHY